MYHNVMFAREVMDFNASTCFVLCQCSSIYRNSKDLYAKVVLTNKCKDRNYKPKNSKTCQMIRLSMDGKD